MSAILNRIDQSDQPESARPKLARRLCFNVFVLVVQAFKKIPALHVLAPTQTEPPFKLTQLVVLAFFVVLPIATAMRFRIEPLRTTSI